MANDDIEELTVGEMMNFRINRKTNELYWGDERVITYTKLDKTDRKLAVFAVCATCISSGAIALTFVINFVYPIIKNLALFINSSF